MFVTRFRWHHHHHHHHTIKVAFAYQQTASLVNIKLKWVKDKPLDAVVSHHNDLMPASLLVSFLSSAPTYSLPIYHLSSIRPHLGLPQLLKLSTFLRRYPTLFHEYPLPNVNGGTVPCFQLTNQALHLHHQELHILHNSESDLVHRLQKLLMLTHDRTLPLQTIDQFKWDMGLPYHYQQTLIPRYPHLFSFVSLPDDRIALKLIYWDERLAISHLQNQIVQENNKDVQHLPFPIGFTRGFGLKKKCIKWLEEWQRLPYTSPYADASHLDSRTDVSEKRIVGVFHELLNLTIHKMTQRKNMSNLRKPLGLPQKFTKVFGRHPGIFYISQKCSTQTIVLREAYDHQDLLDKHPLVGIRQQYASMMKIGFQNRSRGLYKNITGEDHQEEEHCQLKNDSTVIT
ncbi:hypothetical protein AQUCO_00900016v1 [Aquilegia coerulea]|uniref:PORR domain-containing protein n=1 Tax=Aquilegia coerulea TaxID=218851 RepID=A0A2G5EBG3_AQUCA|nr:hypothetical protein AQUCO_00900016v1 [Aquilegia coerulea]